MPFLLVDAMLGAKRERPLTVAGPRDLRYRMFMIAEALFPGMHVMKPKFELSWIELEPGTPTQVGDILVTARSVKHTWQTNPTALRAEVGGKVVCYTGDGEFGEEMALAAKGADLLVAECYFYEKPVRWHLNYPELVAHKADFGARRIILTHMSREMLATPATCPRSAHTTGWWWRSERAWSRPRVPRAPHRSVNVRLSRRGVPASLRPSPAPLRFGERTLPRIGRGDAGGRHCHHVERTAAYLHVRR